MTSTSTDQPIETGPDGSPREHWTAMGHRDGTTTWKRHTWTTEDAKTGLVAALDPCAAPDPRPWSTARQHFTVIDDGLRQPWHGRCWVNPPYSDASPWLARLAAHGCGTALIFARTETATFAEHVWGRASGLLFLRGRLTFCEPSGRPGKGNAGAPSVLVAYGEGDAERLKASGIPGFFVEQPLAIGSVPGLDQLSLFDEGVA